MVKEILTNVKIDSKKFGLKINGENFKEDKALDQVIMRKSL